MTQADQRMPSRQELKQNLRASAKRRAQRLGSEPKNGEHEARFMPKSPASGHNAVLTGILETIVDWSIDWPEANDADLAAALRCALTLKAPNGEAARNLNARWSDISSRSSWTDRTTLPLFRDLSAMHLEHRSTGNPRSMIDYLQTLVS
jgi:hypothetical protein